MIQLDLASDNLHAEKYRGEGEDFREAVNRWAGALSENSEHFEALQDIFGNQRFLMGGRNQSAIGSPRKVTPYNCFVSPIIKDTLTGRGGISDALKDALQTMKLGGGIGFDFSTIRPRKDMIKTVDSQASGPVSFMGIFDAGCTTIKSAGHRRGAMMAVMRVDHPDILEFVRCKQNETLLTGFNISVGVTDTFMKALEEDAQFPLRFKNRTYDKIKARPLWEIIMQNAWDWSEPGVLFLDTINHMNNLYYCEHIAATNPCGEQPLPPNGACLLGSFNLANYMIPLGSSGTGGDILDFHYRIDYDSLKADIPHVVRAMDKIVDIADYPLSDQRDEALAKRRMGLGVTGLANAIEAMGYDYGSEKFCAVSQDILTVIRDGCYQASITLAKEKGAFPLFDRDKYVEGKFIQTLPALLQQGIYEHGIRNSHLLSIAPTGTISLCANNVSAGIEPVLRYSTDRTIQTFDGPTTVHVEDYGVKYFGIRGKKAETCTLDDHLRVQKVAQSLVDSAVSKTINFVPSKGGPDFYQRDFKGLFFQAWRGNLKGITCHNEEGKRAGLFSPEKDEEGQACGIQPETGRMECL